MNICVYNYYEIFNADDEVFGGRHYTLGEDLAYWLRILKRRLEAEGHFVGTIDRKPIEDFDVFLFLDLPKDRDLLRSNRNRGALQYLVTLESEIIRPQNFLAENEALFDQVFTWKPDKKARSHFVYAPIPRDIRINEALFGNPERRLCTMVTSKKRHWHPQELYSERARLISFAMRTGAEDFDLWGHRWEEGLSPIDTCRFRGRKRLFKVASKAYDFVPRKRIPFYKGTTKDKLKTLSGYDFAIASENAVDIDGYVTEKIFDCLRVGTIPVYKGPSDVDSYFPRDVFIDMRDFDTFEALFRRLRTMTSAEKAAMRQAIRDYLEGDQARQFSAEHFVGLVVDAIKRDTMPAGGASRQGDES